MRIGELARASGLSVDTLRFYEKRGLIRSERAANGYRSFDPVNVDLLGYVFMARRLGFTLAEIAAEIPALADAGLNDGRVRALINTKIAAVDARIDDLGHLRDELEKLRERICPIAAPHNG